VLPYVHVADLRILGFLTIHPFGILVAIAVTSGIALAKWRARLRGFDLHELESFIGWMLVCGFVSAHALDAILYRPSEVLARPWSLLFFWEGIGSFSGWIGALAGVVMWRRFSWQPWRWGIPKLVRREHPLPILPFADVILSVFPVAWIFGRTGCSIVHDHPGGRAGEGAPLATAFPSPDPHVTHGAGPRFDLGPITVIRGHFPRYDLGTVELLFTIAVALLFVVLWRKRVVTGTYAVVVSLLYAPARFAMDFLRIEGTPGADPRYLGLTPAQWLCIVLFVFGLVLLHHVRRLRSRRIDLDEPVLTARQ
jgi:phosphatidylglycerol:prolipoprotein diacylglycerol transferase